MASRALDVYAGCAIDFGLGFTSGSAHSSLAGFGASTRAGSTFAVALGAAAATGPVPCGIAIPPGPPFPSVSPKSGSASFPAGPVAAAAFTRGAGAANLVAATGATLALACGRGASACASLGVGVSTTFAGSTFAGFFGPSLMVMAIVSVRFGSFRSAIETASAPCIARLRP